MTSRLSYWAGLCDADLVARLIDEHEIDAIAHFAAKIVVPDSLSDPLGYYLNNTSNARTLIETAIKGGVKNSSSPRRSQGRVVYDGTMIQRANDVRADRDYFIDINRTDYLSYAVTDIPPMVEADGRKICDGKSYMTALVVS